MSGLEPGRRVRPERREGYVVRSRERYSDVRWHWSYTSPSSEEEHHLSTLRPEPWLWFVLMRALGRRPVPWSSADTQEVAP